MEPHDTALPTTEFVELLERENEGLHHLARRLTERFVETLPTQTDQVSWIRQRAWNELKGVELASLAINTYCHELTPELLQWIAKQAWDEAKHYQMLRFYAVAGMGSDDGSLHGHGHVGYRGSLSYHRH